ncbi:MAG: amino acid-binding protein [Eggerthellaceae bacterium]|nr:amino acid-binding protein [Eggerthellaceae bacterium]
MIDQITVFLENSEGRLAALCRTLAWANINMHSLVIADTTDYGVVRIICDDPARAIDVLKSADYRVISTKVAAIGVPNEPGGLAKLLATLDELGQNIEYGYCFTINGGMACDILKISGAKEASEAAKAVEEAGFKLLTLDDIA